jgi:hypothetical protein
MPFAVVQDVPASWEQYAARGAALRESLPEGLQFHLAGPTDEGYRTIEVWATREAWERSRDVGKQPEAEPAWAVPVFRELSVLSAIAATPFPDGVSDAHDSEAWAHG